MLLELAIDVNLHGSSFTVSVFTGRGNKDIGIQLATHQGVNLTNKMTQANV